MANRVISNTLIDSVGDHFLTDSDGFDSLETTELVISDFLAV